MLAEADTTAQIRAEEGVDGESEQEWDGGSEEVIGAEDDDSEGRLGDAHMSQTDEGWEDAQW